MYKVHRSAGSAWYQSGRGEEQIRRFTRFMKCGGNQEGSCDHKILIEFHLKFVVLFYWLTKWLVFMFLMEDDCCDEYYSGPWRLSGISWIFFSYSSDHGSWQIPVAVIGMCWIFLFGRSGVWMLQHVFSCGLFRIDGSLIAVFVDLWPRSVFQAGVCC